MEAIQYLQTQQLNSAFSVIEALRQDKKELAQRLPLNLLKDHRLETTRKIEACNEGWQFYRDTVCSKSVSESLFTLAKERLQEAYNYHQTILSLHDKKMAAEPESLALLKNIPATITEGKITYGYSILTGKYSQLVKYAHPIVATDFKKLAVRGIASKSLDLFATIRKTLIAGSKHGMDRDQVVELLLELVRKDIKGLYESIQNRELDCNEIFARIVSCLADEQDQKKIRQAIMDLKRTPQTQLSITIDTLEKLHLELLQCSLPFLTHAEIEEKNRAAVLAMIGDYCEPMVKDQLNVFINMTQESGTRVTLKQAVHFCSQLENSQSAQYKLSAIKTVDPGTVRTSSYLSTGDKSLLSSGEVSSPAPETLNARGRGGRGRGHSRGRGQRGRGGNSSRGGSDAPSPRGRGSNRGTRTSTRGGAFSSHATVSNEVEQETSEEPKPKGKNKRKSKQSNKCCLCGHDCGGNNGNCKLFPNTRVADTQCSLCGKGFHNPGNICIQIHKKFSSSEN